MANNNSQSKSRLIAISAISLVIAGVFTYHMTVNGRSISTVLSLWSANVQGLFIEAMPFLLFGTLTSGLIAVFIQPEDVRRYLPDNQLLAIFTGLLMGFLFPVAEIGVIPVLYRLFKKGLPLPVGVTFLLSAPFINPVILAGSFIAIGFNSLFIARIVITCSIALLVGGIFALNPADEEDEILVDYHSGHLERDTSRPYNSELVCRDSLNGIHHENIPATPALKTGLSQVIIIAVGDFFSFGTYLVIACLLAGALQTLINPAELSLITGHPVLRVMMMQGYAFIVSIQSTADSFTVLAFVNQFSTGTLIAFLVSGAMLDLKSSLLLSRIFQKRTLLYLLSLSYLMNLLAGVFLNR